MAPKQQQQDPAPEPPAYVDEDHQRIHEFAEDYFDDDEERDEFVNTLMERRGYQRVSSWGPRTEPDPDPEPDPPRQRGGRQGGGSPAPRQRSRAGYFKH
jgi:hypothetical protein